jgi:hypothetical protein
MRNMRLLLLGGLLIFLVVASTNQAIGGYAVPGAYTPPAGYFPSGYRLVDFDTDAAGAAIPDGTAIANQYSAWGVNFAPKAGSPTSARLFANTGGVKDGWDWGDDSISSPNTLAATHDASGSLPIAFVISFNDNLPNTVGIVFTDSAPNDPFTVTAFDSADNQVDSVQIATADSTYRSTGHAEDTFCGLQYAGGIARLEVSLDFCSGSGIRGLEVDNLYIVPEPSSVALLGIAAIGLLAYARRWLAGLARP